MAAFQFHFMVLAIDVIDGRGPSNEMRHQLQLKKNKVSGCVVVSLARPLFHIETFLSQYTKRKGSLSG